MSERIKDWFELHAALYEIAEPFTAQSALAEGDWLVPRSNEESIMQVTGAGTQVYMSRGKRQLPLVRFGGGVPHYAATCGFYRVARHVNPISPGMQRRLLIESYALGLTLGSDPEVFAVDAKGDCVPAWKFLPTKRENPHTFWDGWQAEFNLGGAGSCMDGLCGNIFQRLKHLRSLLPPNCTLVAKEAVRASEEDLAAATDEQVAFGCQPSLNAYGHGSLPISDARNFPWRFAGGHLHFGLGHQDLTKLDYKERCLRAVKAMDAICGVMCVSLFPNENPLRRRYYGMAGEYRLPAHGVEWRTLSNAWLRAPQLMYLVVGTARAAFNIGWEDKLSKVYRASEQEVVECINNCDVRLAQRLIRRNAVVFGQIFHGMFGTQDRLGLKTLKVVRAGYESVFSTPMNIYANWRLHDDNYYYSGLDTGRWGPFIKKATI